MQLVINTYGSYIQKNGDCFKVKKDEQIFEISAKKVSSILITTAAYITTDSIKLAIDNNIDIIFMDNFGEPFGRVWHPKLGSTTLIRRRQLEISNTQDGLNFVKKWVKTKFDNQINLLTSLRTTRTKKSKEITEYILQLKNIKKKFDDLTDNFVPEIRDIIMGIEGSGAKVYFDCISFLMPERFKFLGRSRNPAKDEFNALLNYSYGILYSRVEKACIIAGLDPYVGILHTDHYNKKSMVFDIIENYRIWADEIVINLFAGRKIKQEHFDKLKNGLSLNAAGKALLIKTYTEFMEESVRYKGRNIKRDNIIQFDCHNIANELIKKNK
jgi:CRISPR-associated protein Cas1